MHYFVTGASGLIGRSLVKELISSGHTVLGLARSDASAEIITSLGAQVHRGDLYNLESLKSGAAQCDGVAHLAFVHDFDGKFDFEGWCQTDRAAITALAEVLKGTSKPLIITNGVLFLPKDRLATEKDTYNHEEPFAKLRGASEDLSHSLAKQGVKTMVVRLGKKQHAPVENPTQQLLTTPPPAPSNHGHEDQGLITMLINKAREIRVSCYFNEGTNTWPAVHKLDTAKLYALALERGRAGATYHAVAEQGVSLKDIAVAIGEKTGLPTKSLTVEEGQKHFGNIAFAVVGDCLVSSDATQAELGWKPEGVALLADIAGDAYV